MCGYNFFLWLKSLDAEGSDDESSGGVRDMYCLSASRASVEKERERERGGGSLLDLSLCYALKFKKIC